MTDAKRDQNYVTTLLGVSSVDGITPVTIYVDPVTHRVLTSATGGGVAGLDTQVQFNDGGVMAGNAGLTFVKATGILTATGFSGPLTGAASLNELLTNKATTFGTINDTLYPTVKAVNDAITTAVIGLLDYRGSYDASTNLFPATGGSGIAGAIFKGDFWIVSVAGTLGTIAVTPGDLVIALVDTPAQTASNWDLIQHDLNNAYLPKAGGTMTGDILGAVSLGATGTRLTKVWATDVEVTNAIAGSITGNAATATKLAATKMINGVAFDGSANIVNAFAEGTMINGRIAVSVASNNLTVALKTLAGTNPSATDPVYVMIGGVVRSITAALSKTLNAGANSFNAGSAELATKEIDYFAYLGYNATDGVVLGFSRIPYAALYSDFSATATNEKFASISTITTAAAGDNYVNIGRFAAILSAGAGYTWTVPTFTTANLIQRLIYETRILLYVPTVTGYNAANALTVRYRIRGLDVTLFDLNIYGTSNSATFDLTLPFTPNVDAGVFFSKMVFCSDNSTWSTNASIFGISNSATAKVGINGTTQAANAFGGFTTSGNKQVVIESLSYPI